MSEETIILFVVPVIAFAGTVLVAHWLGKLRQGIALAGLVLLWAGFTGAMFLGWSRRAAGTAWAICWHWRCYARPAASVLAWAA